MLQAPGSTTQLATKPFLTADFCCLSQTKAEQEQYLRQLEEEGRAQEVYGKGMQLVLPTPAFVAKTANSQSGQKVFINVCTSDKVGAGSAHHPDAAWFSFTIC